MRLDEALATGLSLAIEQDLHWYVGSGAPPQPVVAHDDDALEGAPTLDTHFFARIEPIMKRALAENERDTWPLITLNLDFKDNTPAHLDAVWASLGKYEAWLTTATRTVTPSRVESLVPGPLLVLAGSDTAQRRRFHDEVPVGAKLRAFGAMAPAPVRGATKALRARRAMQMTSAQHINVGADNFARWVNFPWSVIEAGGPTTAGKWVPADSARLNAFVQQVHRQGFLIRFYTLDGFTAADDRGFAASYNFGSRAAATARWRATLSAGVDFVATDHYADFTALRP